MNNHKVAADILAQVQGEAGARHDYELLIADGGLDAEDVKVIQEIQADEANHMIKLMAMVKKYDCGISASADGLAVALNKIRGE